MANIALSIFSSPVGVFFLFIIKEYDRFLLGYKVFFPCRGFILIYVLKSFLLSLLLLVFIPCRGFLLIY